MEEARLRCPDHSAAQRPASVCRLGRDGQQRSAPLGTKGNRALRIAIACALMCFAFGLATVQHERACAASGPVSVYVGYAGAPLVEKKVFSSAELEKLARYKHLYNRVVGGSVRVISGKGVSLPTLLGVADITATDDIWYLCSSADANGAAFDIDAQGKRTLAKGVIGFSDLMRQRYYINGIGGYEDDGEEAERSPVDSMLAVESSYADVVEGDEDDDPDDSDDSGEPEDPGNSDEPNDPGNSGASGDPGGANDASDPDNTGGSGKPDDPNGPGKPDAPDDPDDSDKPGSQGGLEGPGGSGDPADTGESGSFRDSGAWGIQGDSSGSRGSSDPRGSEGQGGLESPAALRGPDASASSPSGRSSGARLLGSRSVTTASSGRFGGLPEFSYNGYRLLYGLKGADDRNNHCAEVEVKSLTFIYRGAPSIQVAAFDPSSIDVDNVQRTRAEGAFTVAVSLDSVDDDISAQGLADIEWRGTPGRVRVSANGAGDRVVITPVGEGDFEVVGTYGYSENASCRATASIRGTILESETPAPDPGMGGGIGDGAGAGAGNGDGGSTDAGAGGGHDADGDGAADSPSGEGADDANNGGGIGAAGESAGGGGGGQASGGDGGASGEVVGPLSPVLPASPESSPRAGDPATPSDRNGAVRTESETPRDSLITTRVDQAVRDVRPMEARPSSRAEARSDGTGDSGGGTGDIAPLLEPEPESDIVYKLSEQFPAPVAPDYPLSAILAASFLLLVLGLLASVLSFKRRLNESVVTRV